MDIDKIFHMKGGHGEASYSRNSSLQRKGSDMVKHIMIDTIQELYRCTTPQSLAIADLGSSCGPNSLSLIKDIYHAAEDAYRKALINGSTTTPPEVSMYLNDLPNNDFNLTFRALPEMYHEIFGERDGNITLPNKEGQKRPALFVAAFPGSFYDRIFPQNFLHFVYSSYSLHWLSKVPPGIYDEHGKSMNKGCIYICENSPQTVIKAYEKQFQENFSRFLHLRSQELIQGGRMVLIFLGRDSSNHIDRGNSFLWQLLAQSFTILVSQGRILEEKLDSYDVHFYAPSKEEVQEQLEKEGSFELDRLEMFTMERAEDKDITYGMAVARTVRAIQESMITHHFGADILDALFQTYAALVDEEMCKQEIRPVTFIVTARKL